MSEYQYYEFQAIDRPLTEGDREALRGLSSRARITASSFVNSYEWGDFKGDPMKLMERWFDLHLYLANWGSRRLVMRVPKKQVDLQDLVPYLSEVDEVTVRTSGDDLLLDINRDEVEPEDWGDGSGWLAALAPLRAELLGGDRRMPGTPCDLWFATDSRRKSPSPFERSAICAPGLPPFASPAKRKPPGGRKPNGKPRRRRRKRPRALASTLWSIAATPFGAKWRAKSSAEIKRAMTEPPPCSPICGPWPKRGARPNSSSAA